ncbi:glutathione S-transferase [Luminiphilus syltensis NOR5-1B]|uniref:Glutathione S-transferase n=1 Tax=Luminiphilus syltensis NOR5-1B TaxID=565045 RepID=B8KQH2_9GAMM|nr:glutathione S-transferase family protein [Luminiphilus syltensis]EED36244.1 glutathione S-transferase [Luminiphilus syltensis NOR5-1B]
MTQPILHHHDPSPFAEKARLIFGLKALGWYSVEVPMVMPKPELTALTGGYRKAPVMQIGADIYCDTRRIALELERRFPNPSLFPHGAKGAALALGFWADTALFHSGATLSMGTNDAIPEVVLKDRLAFFDFMSESDLNAAPDHFYSQFCSGLRQLEDMLADGRQWLLGDEPGWADFACFSPVWMCRGNIKGGEDILASLPRVVDWEARVGTIGHGTRTGLDAKQALEIAHNSTSETEPNVSDTRWPKLNVGTRVSVAPDDYGMDPCIGTLRVLNDEEIAVTRHLETGNEVVVHFPRFGYRVIEYTGDSA